MDRLMNRIVKDRASTSNTSTRDWIYSYMATDTCYYEYYLRLLRAGTGNRTRYLNDRDRTKQDSADLSSVSETRRHGIVQ